MKDWTIPAACVGILAFVFILGSMSNTGKLSKAEGENRNLQAQNKSLQNELELWKASQNSYETNLDMVVAYYTKKIRQIYFNYNNDLPMTNNLSDAPPIRTIKPVMAKPDE